MISQNGQDRLESIFIIIAESAVALFLENTTRPSSYT
jgi:hypothetical protein